MAVMVAFIATSEANNFAMAASRVTRPRESTLWSLCCRVTREVDDAETFVKALSSAML